MTKNPTWTEREQHNDSGDRAVLPVGCHGGLSAARVVATVKAMKSARATLVFDPDTTRHFRLPASGSPSLLYVFTPERQLGARAYSETGDDFFPGSTQSRVRLDFWAEDEWTEVVQPGATFTIWYGGDVGRGVIYEIVELPRDQRVT